MTKPLSRFTLPVIVALYAALTLLLIVRIPLGAAPDEPAHLEYVAHLAYTGTLPIFQPLGAGHAGYEFHQPPLYYAVCSVFLHLVDTPLQPYLCRGISLLFGAGTIVLMWFGVGLMFPDDKQLAVLATGFAALLPMQIAIGACAGNDAAAGFFCAALFWCLARSMRSWTLRDCVLLGLAAGLGLLSKSSCFGVAVIAILAAAWFAASSGESRTARLQAALLSLSTAVAVTLLVSGWWLWRNQHLYGDPLAARVFDLAFSRTSPSPHAFLLAGVTLSDYLNALELNMFCTFWGFFGGPNSAFHALNVFGTTGPKPEVNPAKIPMVLCALITAAAFWGAIRHAAAFRGWDLPLRRVAVVWLIGLVVVWATWARFNLDYFQAQARYIQPGLLPGALLMAMGWRAAIAPRLGTRGVVVLSSAVALLMIGLTLWNAFGWRTLV